MGSYSDELRAEGRAQGRAEGLAQGISQGIAQGRAEERSAILKVLGVSKEEYERKLAEKKRAEGEA